MSASTPVTPELISVVMPCFNPGAFLEHAVVSALGQTYGNVELIVVDDGSTDGSRDVLVGLERQYRGRMSVLHQERQGPFPARNLGIRNAHGTFIAFLDADDYWVDACLEKLSCAIQSSGADLAYCGWQNVGEGAPGTEPYVPPTYETLDPVESFLKSCPWPIHAALVRREVVDQVNGFSTRMFTSMDYDLWLRILATTRKFIRVSEVLAFYRWHGPSQISAVKWRQVLNAWQVRRDFVNSHPDLVAHLSRGLLRELMEGELLKAAYAAYWKRDLVSAQPLFRKAAKRGYWRLRDARYVLPSLLPARVYRRLVSIADARGESEAR